MNKLDNNKFKLSQRNAEKDLDGEIVRFNKPKGIEIIVGIIFIILCINSLYAFNNLTSKGVKVGKGYVIFNLIIIILSGYFSFTMLLKDKLGYIRLGKDYIGINKFIKEKKIKIKDINKIIKIKQKDKLICYRLITKEGVFDVPMDYYKEEEINKINAYLKSRGKL